MTGLCSSEALRAEENQPRRGRVLRVDADLFRDSRMLVPHPTGRARAAFLGALCLLCSVGFAEPAQAQAPDRGGFTLLLDLGVGFQHDDFFDQTETGLAGLNLGIGGFVSDRVALLFRASGTTVSLGGVGQTSGFGGPAVQYWPTERFNVEAGAGVGFWSLEEVSDTGVGLLAGAGYAFFNRGKHNLQVGAFYALAFTQPDLIHNLGLVFGWQLL